MLARHYEVNGVVEAQPEEVFAYLDDHARLSSHMSQSSWKMGGGRMELRLDEEKGRSVGSRIRLAGRAFGVALFVEEKVTERAPPHRKAWETIGTPRLLVIAHYRLGFDIASEGRGSSLRVFIDYAVPTKGFSKWLGVVFGDAYAKWCVRQMLHDTQARFASTGS